MSDPESPALDLTDVYSTSDYLERIENSDGLAAVRALGRELPSLVEKGIVSYLAVFDAADIINVDRRARVQWSYLLKESLPAYDADPPWVWKTYLAYSAAHKTQGAMHAVLDGIEGWMAAYPHRQQPMLSIAIGNGVSDSPIPWLVMRAMVNSDAPAALAAALALTDDPRAQVRAGAIATLGQLVGNTEVKDEPADRLLALFDRAEDEEISNESRALALRAMLSHLETASKRRSDFNSRVDAALSQSEANLRYQLYDSLFRQKTALTKSQSQALFSTMSEIAPEDRGTMEAAGMALYGLDPIKDRAEILSHLSTFLASQRGRKLEELYFIDSRISDAGPEIPYFYAADMLVDGRFRVANAVSDLFGPIDETIGVLDFEDPRWTDGKASRWTPEQLGYLVRRSVAFLFFSHGPAVSLMGSALARLADLVRAGGKGTANAKRHRDDSIDFIQHIWLRCYPGDIDLFEAFASQCPCAKTLVQKIKRDLAAYQTAVFELPPNKAFRRSAHEEQVQSEQWRQRQVAISNVANKTSIFADIMSKRVLLYGDSAMMNAPTLGTEPERDIVTPMHTFETSMALPRLEILHPVKFGRLLYRLRSEAPPQ